MTRSRVARLLIAWVAGIGPVTPAAAQVSAGPGEPTSSQVLLVLDATGFGVDPVVAAHVTEELQQTGTSSGYPLVPPSSVRAARDRLRLAGAAKPADLWRATYLTGAARGVTARVWAEEGRYQFEITVASLDGAGPFFGRGDASAGTLREAVRGQFEALLSGLPPISMNERAVAAPRPGPGTTFGALPPGSRSRDGGVSQGNRRELRPSALGGDAGTPSPRERGTGRRFQLALQSEGAIGVSADAFYNHLVGARVDLRFGPSVLVGGYVGYANLRGRNGRVSNLIGMLHIENRVRVVRQSRLTLPLRLGVGYVPFNGPVVRLAAGVNLPLSDRMEIGVDLLAPTFWVLPDGAAVSMNVAAEWIWRL